MLRLLLLCAVVPVLGCGGKATITGTVSHGGQPVVWGTVALKGADGKIHVGEIGLDGAFRIEGIPPGEYRVAVMSPDPAKALGKKRPLPPAGAWKPLPPTAGDYETSGLTKTVAAGQLLDIVIPQE